MRFSAIKLPVKRYLPRTLFGRAMLIIVVPTLFVQLISTYMFYERHWENVRKHMAIALANDVAYIVQQMEQSPEMRWEAMHKANRFFDLSSRWEPNATLPARGSTEFHALAKQLYAQVDVPDRKSVV